MKRFLPLAILGVAQVFFLATAFFAGYLVRATDVDAVQPFNLLSASGGVQYPLLSEIHGLLATHYIGTLPDDKTAAKPETTSKK